MHYDRGNDEGAEPALQGCACSASRGNLTSWPTRQSEMRRARFQTRPEADPEAGVDA